MKKETTQAVREQLQKGGSTYAEGGEVDDYKEREARHIWNTMDRFDRADFLDEIELEDDANLGESRFSMKAYKYDDLPKHIQVLVQEKLGYDIEEEDYAEGGEIYEIHSKHKDSIDSFEVDSNLQTWNTHSDAKKQADQLNKDSNSFKYKVVKKGGSTY